MSKEIEKQLDQLNKTLKQISRNLERITETVRSEEYEQRKEGDD